MRLETIFEKFEVFADAPGAVDRMRKIIIDFASTGRLVSRVLTEGTGLEALASVGLQPDNPGSANVLPSHWSWVTLGKIAISMDSGWSPACSTEAAEPEAWGVLKTTSVQRLEYQEEQNKALPLNLTPRPEHEVKEGDILFSRAGPMNRVGVICVAKPTRPRLMISDKIIRFHLFDFVDPVFAALVLNGGHSSVVIEGLKSGMAASQVNISQPKLKSVPVPLPPISEQKRIVAKVDELMALCDRLEAQQCERENRHSALALAALARFSETPTPENIDLIFHKSYTISPADLRRSILTLAVQGKLVPQDPNDEPADEILAGIADDVAKQIHKRRMRNSRPISTYKGILPFNLPASWEWAALGTLTAAEDAAMCDGPFGSKLKTEHYISTQGYAVLRLGNIGVGHFIHGKEGYISRKHYESLPSNHTAPGDLLVAGLADPLVRCCEIPPDLGPAVNKSDCFRVRIHSQMERSYVRHYLNSPIAKIFAAEENHGMTRERINLANAKALPVPIPPRAEQRRIVAKIDQLMAIVGQLENQITAARDTATHLLDALVVELTGTTPKCSAGRAVTPSNFKPDFEPQSVNLNSSTEAEESTPPSRNKVASLTLGDDALALTRLTTLLRERGSLSNGEAQAATGLDASEVRYLMKRIVSNGLARIEGQKRGTRYVALADTSVAARTGKKS